MDIAAVQRRLAAAGFLVAADGALGPLTLAAVLGYAAQRQLGPLGDALGGALRHLVDGGVVAGDLGLAHWTAQAAHETEGFRFLVEQGGPTYFARYDGRADLGNTEAGDGYLFRGRGIFQITGRWNYQHFGRLVGEPLEERPDLAMDPAIAVAIAGAFWTERGIQAHAAADDVEAVTRKINGGLNGLQDRQMLTLRLKRLFGLA